MRKCVDENPRQTNNVTRKSLTMGRRILFALFVIILGGLTAAAWYAYDKGFTKKWRGYVTEEFRKQGMEVSLRRLTLDPFRGLVAKEVRVLDTKDKKRTLAVIDEVLLGINYAEAMRGGTFLETLDLRDANLSLPLDPKNPRGERVEITRLNARLFLPPQQIYLARAEAEIEGIRIYAAGRLINPRGFELNKENETRAVAKIAERVVDEIKAMKFGTEAPLLTVQFSGDLAVPAKLAVDVRLNGADIQWRDYRCDEVAFAANLRNGVIEVQRCELRDSRGTLQAHASYEPASRRAQVRVSSGIDLPTLLRSTPLRAYLNDWAFYSAPLIELSASFEIADVLRSRYSGNLALQKFAYKTVVFDGLRADGSWDDQRWSVRDLSLSHKTGQLTGDLMQLPGDLRARVHSTISPKLIAPLLSGKAAEWFSQFNFQDAPTFEIDVWGPRLDPEARATGAYRIGGASFRNPPAAPFSTDKPNTRAFQTSR
jgi:hypothetical protein